MNNSNVLRVARPTDNLDRIASMYCQGLGFQVLASFKNHEGFDGAIIGKGAQAYHLEFTHCLTHSAGKRLRRATALDASIDE